ncbi:hypothetical protein E2C01_029083 [Portunus trituberculatus]|uniref:Uncharacterized protein n=1 Tax=Portunus trituberculatus TaxID=210409 RepID=A0A5B7ETQ4_PORTR|nr:hypothetical protein [Portunus trituberculatus]
MKPRKVRGTASSSWRRGASSARWRRCCKPQSKPRTKTSLWISLPTVSKPRLGGPDMSEGVWLLRGASSRSALRTIRRATESTERPGELTIRWLRDAGRRVSGADELSELLLSETSVILPSARFHAGTLGQEVWGAFPLGQTGLPPSTNHIQDR